MVKGEPSTKRAQEGDDIVPVVKADDVVPVVKEDDAVLVVKDDDAMPVVNQDEALVDPFGDRDDWAVGIMSKAFLKIALVLQNTGLCTLNPPREEKVSSYVFIFHQLADVLEELSAYLNKNHVDNEYILACYQSRIDGFDTTIMTQGIITAHNIKKHWHNLVCLMLGRWPTASPLTRMMMPLIPTRRTRTRTVIPTTSRGVNKVPFDVSHVAFDVSHVAFDVSSLCWEYRGSS